MFLTKFAVFLTICFGLTDKSSATIDLSNLDLSNFKFFKYPAEESTPYSSHLPSPHSFLKPVTDHLQKAKSVLVYFKNVLLGNPEHKQEAVIEFDPHFGQAWQPHYEHHYGHKGENLVYALGNGYSSQQLKHYGAVGHDFEDF